MRPCDQRQWKTARFYGVIQLVVAAVVLCGQTYLGTSVLAATPTVDTETTDTAATHKDAARQGIERSIRDYFTSMSNRDLDGLQAVLDNRFVAIEASDGTGTGGHGAKVHLVDTTNPNEMLPPKGNDDWENVKISDVRAEISTTHPSVATVSFTLSWPLDPKTLAGFKEALETNVNALSDAQKKAITKTIDDKVVNNSMLAILAQQDGKWKIICMSFPR